MFDTAKIFIYLRWTILDIFVSPDINIYTNGFIENFVSYTTVFQIWWYFDKDQLINATIISGVFPHILQEFVAYGFTNIACSFFSCYTHAASLSRSLIQEAIGGKTQVAYYFITNLTFSRFKTWSDHRQ